MLDPMGSSELHKNTDPLYWISLERNYNKSIVPDMQCLIYRILSRAVASAPQAWDGHAS